MAHPALLALAFVARHLPEDWFNLDILHPMLLEDFCETGRVRGISCHAANWIHVGRTYTVRRSDSGLLSSRQAPAMENHKM